MTPASIKRLYARQRQEQRIAFNQSTTQHLKEPMTETKTTADLRSRHQITGWKCTSNPDGTITETVTHSWLDWPTKAAPAKR